MRLKIKDRLRAWRRAALAPLNRSYGRVKRALQSFIIKTVAMHGTGTAHFAKEASPVNNELLLALFKATQRPAPPALPVLQAVPIGDGRLLAVHPLAGFMFVGTHEVSALPQIVLAKYQQRQTVAIEHEVISGARVLHLGAGQGFHTLSLAKVVGPEGAVVAVSSDNADREILKVNVGLHELEDVVSVHATLEDALRDHAVEPDLVYVTDGFRLPSAWYTQLVNLVQRCPETRILIGARLAGIDALVHLVEETNLPNVPTRLAA